MNTIPRSVWALGFVSLFMDVSSEMIHALLPAYLVAVLGASAVRVGLIEGVAEAAASITKVFSGALSDWMGRRKLLTIIGYGLSAATKPIFAMAGSVGPVFTARLLDRVGKGVRGAPRDALVADVTPAELRGASFGLRQSLDTVGAFLGPLAAIGLMVVTANAFRTVFWIATVPAAIAVLVLILGVKEPERRSVTGQKPPHLSDARRMGGAFWGVVGVAAVLTLARFSEAFLILRAEDVGLRLALLPLVIVVMNIVYALAAYPAGALADAAGRRRVLGLGLVFLVIADTLLALGNGNVVVLIGVAFWGLHMGFTQGIFATLIADTTPPHLRGSGFGLFHLVVGVATLAASVIAGVLWDAYGASVTFLSGAVLTILSLATMAVVPISARPPSSTPSRP